MHLRTKTVGSRKDPLDENQRACDPKRSRCHELIGVKKKDPRDCKPQGRGAQNQARSEDQSPSEGLDIRNQGRCVSGLLTLAATNGYLE